jgi:hypothetical protein
MIGSSMRSNDNFGAVLHRCHTTGSIAEETLDLAEELRAIADRCGWWNATGWR